jgi:hypothetical protein
LHVDWALACRRVRWTAEAADVYDAGRDTFWRPGLPAHVALPVVVRVAAPEIECGPEVEHWVEGYLLGPGMSVLEALEFGLGIEPDPEHLAGYEVTMLLSLQIRFEAEQEGNHGLELRIDGKFRWLVSFFVRIGQSPYRDPGAREIAL